MGSENINSGSYAQYDDYDILPYTLVKYLMNNNEMVWRLLKYSGNDAWDQPNLTFAQKGALIYNGASDNTVDYRVFLDRGQPDVQSFETCQIRIANYSVFPENRTVGTVSMIFEVYTHYKANHLSNYRTRNDMIMKQLRQTFNGKLIPVEKEDGGSGTIGKLYFDRKASESTRQELGGQLPFLGSWMIMSFKSN